MTLNVKSVLVFAYLLFWQQGFSQYTDVINSNRPGHSFSAYAPGKNVYQGEIGATIGHEEHELFGAEVDYIRYEYAIRVGIWKDRLELMFDGAYQIDEFSDRGRSFNRSGPLRNTFGAKWLLYDPQKKINENFKPNIRSWKANQNLKFKWRNLIPAVSVYGGANIHFSDSPFVFDSSFNFFNDTESDLSGKLMAITQSHITSRWVLVTNFGVDKIGTDFSSLQYIVTLTHAFNTRWAAFAENQGFDSDFNVDNIFRFGGAYLINGNLQFDASVGFNTKDTPSKFFGGVGFSYRLDYHKTEWVLVDQDNVPLRVIPDSMKENQEITQKRRGFFGRLFGKKQDTPELDADGNIIQKPAKKRKGIFGRWFNKKDKEIDPDN
ncbi:MAG: transporter [Flavobacteriaceae bacterium]|nr:transporter [Flavobacteriaceae bacterium]